MVSQRNDIQMLKRWNLGNMTKLLLKHKKLVVKMKTQSEFFVRIGTSDLPKNTQ